MEIKQEANTDVDPLSLVKFEPVESDLSHSGIADILLSAPIKQEPDICDLETLIEVKEELIKYPPHQEEESNFSDTNL